MKKTFSVKTYLLIGKTKKTWLIMKAIFIFLFVGMMQVSAGVYSQQIRFSIKLSDVSIDEVIKEIRKSSEFDFVFDYDLIRHLDNVSVEADNATVEEILEGCLGGSNIDYKIEDKVILLVPAQKTLEPILGEQQAQTIIIKGKVTDKKGEPIPFVSVYVKGETTGVITGKDGTYSIQVQQKEGMVLVTSFIGFITQEVQVAGRTVIDFVLESDVVDINEVVVTGYQTISRERSTGAFGRIDGELLKERPNPDIATSLEGSLTGFQLIPTTNPDGSITYNYSVRGISTLTSSISKPLIVVDGFPVSDDFSSIDPNDIESITVLKDASAASIWGARAANGVIVIVTSKGKTDSKVKVEVNSLVRISPKLDLNYVAPKASSETQIAWEKYVYDNNLTGNLTPSALGEVTTSLTSSLTLYNEFKLGNITEQEYNSAISELTRNSFKDDVNKYLLQMAKYQQHNVKVSGSSNKNNYVFSALYDIQDSDYKGTGTSKALLNFRDQFQVSKHVAFHAGATVKLQQNKNNGANLRDIRGLLPYQRLVDDDGNYTSMVKDYYLPILDEVSENGDFPYDNWNYNLLQETRSRNIKTDNNTIRLQFGLNVKFLKNFVFDSKYQYEINTSDYEAIYSEESYLVRNQVNRYNAYDPATGKVTRLTGDGYAYPEGSALDRNSTKRNNYVFRNQLQFNRSFSDLHHVTVLAGSEVSEYINETNRQVRVWGYDTQRRIFANQPFYKDFGAREFYRVNKTRLVPSSNSNRDWFSSETNNRFFSLYGNFSYNYDGKYTLTASLRTDASNMIVEDPKYRYAPFWSVGARWALEKESFMDNVEWVNQLQLRTSYGIAGNVVTSTSVLPLISYSVIPSRNTGEFSAFVRDFGNPLLRWEQTKSTNIGVDFSLFENKLFGKVDVYNKKSEDVLASIDVPAVYGQGFTNAINAAELTNKGIEIELGVNQKITENLNWRGKIIFFRNKNEVSKLNVNRYADSFLVNASIQSRRFVEGVSVSPIYSYVYAGENEDNIPLIQFEDGQTVEIFNIPAVTDTRSFVKYQGSRIPLRELAFDNTLSYKGLSLRFLISGKFGHHFRAEAPNYSFLSNAAFSTLTKPMDDVLSGNSTKFPGLPPATAPDVATYADIVRNFNTLVEDASNIRLKEVLLSYKLHKSITTRLGLASVRIFCQARDLGIIWKATDTRFDPDFPAYRPVESYTFGANIAF